MVELQRGHTEEAAAHFRVALAGNFRLAHLLYQALATLGTSLDAVQVTPATPRAQAALGAWLYENDLKYKWQPADPVLARLRMDCQR